MIVADTSVWIDYVKGIDAAHTDALDSALLHDRIVVGDVILAEFLQGFRNEAELHEARLLLDRLEYRDMVGRQIALASAANYRHLRSRGVTVRKTIDTLIATFCMENGFELIHNDRDFDPFEEYLGLRVRHGKVQP
ncbi:MAG: PIN domain nuclease [Spirochaetota bacterium]